MAVPVLKAPTIHWVCEYCPFEDITNEPRPHQRFHRCPGLKGITAPMIEKDAKWHVRTVEREDYVGSEIVQTDSDGRPIMALITERPDGQDVAVLAPTAVGHMRDMG